MLEDAKKFSSGLDELYKRWFDNMKEYLERKGKRIAGNANGNNGDAKKAKTTGDE